ncbi:hypothetical protein ALC60_09547 [Trachymyrmex zeteki]|uniref:Uncharacterized protein n=1 Tax=Mycetomoellerius zeteki TaxID=64791 RepID=A0A151WUG0_9HYME|nr:hypothetical protein ALC60_09547 [Trachymyrmex zeteki]
MSIRVSGVYLVPTSPGTDNGGNDKSGVDVNLHHQQQHHHHHHHHSTTKTVTIVTAPQRSNSLDYLNFEEKRQIIASSLSLSDFLAHGPAVFKEVAANTVIGCSSKLREKFAAEIESRLALDMRRPSQATSLSRNVKAAAGQRERKLLRSRRTHVYEVVGINGRYSVSFSARMNSSISHRTRRRAKAM